MSYLYPQDRHRDRREKAEQPCRQSHEAMAETDAEIQARAEAFGEAKRADSRGGVADAEEMEAALERSLREANAEIMAERERENG